MTKKDAFWILFVVVILGSFYNLDRIDYFVHGKTEYNVTYDTNVSSIDLITNNFTTTYTTTEIWTKYSPVFNKPNITKKIGVTKIETHINTKQDYLNRISITGSSENDIDIVKDILVDTDAQILKYIKQINIQDTENVNCNYYNAIGCSENYYPSKEQSVVINIIASKYYLPRAEGNMITTLIGTFENTVNHEIGHTDGIANHNNDDSEYYANNYANIHTRIKEKSKQEYLEGIQIISKSNSDINSTKRILATAKTDALKNIKYIYIYEGSPPECETTYFNYNNEKYPDSIPLGCAKNQTIFISSPAFINTADYKGNWIYATPYTFESVLNDLLRLY